MRVLKKDEMRILFTKIVKFQKNFFFMFVKNCIKIFFSFRIIKRKVFFVRNTVMCRGVLFYKKNLMSLGTCIGNFNRFDCFYFFVTALNFLNSLSNFNFVIIKNFEENSFIKGKHLKKFQLSSITRQLSSNDGVLVFNENNLLLGFGEIVKNFSQVQVISKNHIVIINQGDIGKYVRIIPYK
ncbi:ribosome biogenesis protein (nucleomorph) [Cryptomonas paramecium]|uniref:60S ribosome subunit biogenesis protein NIP7 homolog n=1 Tax=Cryptomonas paramaecium TaxID=2898 RepID=F2HI37_9CRYP|nr:ribosome biogenesis protein [Cryptomonas paramecium]AEA38983.1 ribosome biogenesis protein [Cryptomonas paramecium]|mmetsp:Transcript_16021/g.43347  ORF Transcript_16021/g.43347 Transcript_16021/m.43347 type:complete len:182 (+) Transcript_16021:6226-6771(+)